MADESARTREALKNAIDMETAGHDNYIAMAKECGNEPGRELFEQLAKEEEGHRRSFERIFDSIRRNNAWPAPPADAINAGREKPLLTGITPELCRLVKPEEAEIEAVKTAIRMENDSYDFYWKQYSQALYPAEKEFYDKVAKTENAHRLALLDYLEFLLNPAGYFVNKEHPSLD